MDFIRKNWQILTFIFEVGVISGGVLFLKDQVTNLNLEVTKLQIQVAQQSINIQWLKDVSTKNYKGD